MNSWTLGGGGRLIFIKGQIRVKLGEGARQKNHPLCNLGVLLVKIIGQLLMHRENYYNEILPPKRVVTTGGGRLNESHREDHWIISSQLVSGPCELAISGNNLRHLLNGVDDSQLDVVRRLSSVEFGTFRQNMFTFPVSWFTFYDRKCSPRGP